MFGAKMLIWLRRKIQVPPDLEGNELSSRECGGCHDDFLSRPCCTVLSVDPVGPSIFIDFCCIYLRWVQFLIDRGLDSRTLPRTTTGNAAK